MTFNIQHMAKRAIIAIAAVFTASACFGQGQIQFATFNGTNATMGRVFQSDGTTGLNASYFGQLLGGTSSGSLAPIGVPVAFSPLGGGGFINDGTVNIPGTFGGDTYFYALAAWSSTSGATYAAALAAGGVTDSRTKGGLGIGIIQVSLGGVPSGGGTPLGAPNANQFLSFSLVPEPSTIALGLLGAGALLLRRRK